jgi:hypothetical protein
MALPVDALKIVIGGQIDGVQDWSVGLWTTIALTGGAWGVANQNEVTAELEVFVSTWWTHVEEVASSVTFLEYVKTYYYPAGSTHSSQLGVFTLTSPAPGEGPQVHAAGTSMVCSLRSDVPGRSGRGRIYVPANGVSMSEPHQMNGGECSNICDATATLLGAFNTYTNPSQHVTSLAAVVASFTRSETNSITQVIVDDKPDSQRRREDKMPIGFTAVAAV